MKKTNIEDLLLESALSSHPELTSFDLEEIVNRFKTNPLEVITSLHLYEFLFFIEPNCEELINLFTTTQNSSISQILSNNKINKTSREFLLEFIYKCQPTSSFVSHKELRRLGFDSELLFFHKNHEQSSPDVEFISKSILISANNKPNKTSNTSSKIIK